MTSQKNKDDIEMNVESCRKMLSDMQQFNETTMKLRLEIAEIQMKVLSLYEAPNLQFLQLLIDIPGTCQMNDSIQHPDEAIEVNKDIHNSL